MLLPSPGTPRILAFATLANTVGNGAYLAVSVLFLTRVVGLAPAEMAAGLSAGAVAGMLLTTPLGYLADLWGPKWAQIGALVTLGGAFAALTLVRNVWTFVPLACVIAVAEATVKSANGAMIAGAVPPDERLRLRAYMRSVNNLGMGLGTLLGGLPLLLDSRVGYVSLILADSASSLLAAAVLSRAALGVRPPRPQAGPRLVALRDRAFLSFALVDGLVASAYNGLLGIGLPLWLVARTHAPLWLVSAALVINTAGCVLLQVRVARHGDDPATGARLSRRGAALIAGACVLFALSAHRPSWLVGAIVVVAAAVHVTGELWLSTGTWTVVFGLAPDWAQGQYQGAYFTGRQIGDMVTPPLLTACVIGLGAPGWGVLATLFAAAGLTYPALVRWGVRTRDTAAAGPVAAAARG